MTNNEIVYRLQIPHLDSLHTTQPVRSCEWISAPSRQRRNPVLIKNID